jgi:multidrug efflux pump subunit AcrA (membrane-fusion protein)
MYKLIHPDDIEKVVEGQPAEVRLTAFSRRFYDPVQGAVVFISADSYIDEQTLETYYVARIAITAEAIANAIGDQELRPGMQCEVMIKTGERTVLDYLLRPISRTLDRAMREE